MSVDARVLIEAARLAEQGVPFVLITVAVTRGSSPRNAGAKMVWRPNDVTTGSIGGGELEHLALDEARTRLESGAAGIERFVLGADADQCCGGTVELFFEPFAARRRIVIFGAGHVAYELVRCLEQSPLEIVVVDARSSWNTSERFAHCRRIVEIDEGVRLACAQRASTLVCVMSHSHDLDFEILAALLVEPPAFVGLIGSKSKRACFVTRLTAAGIEAGCIERMRCPIGLGNMGKAPGLVAVSIAGEILLEARALGIGDD